MAVMLCRRLTLVAIVAAGSGYLTAQDRTPPDPPADGVVMGFVRFANGQGIADVRVSLIIDRSATTTRTAADGSYGFEAIPAGEYQVSASLPGAVARQVRVAAGSLLHNIDFSIPDGSSRRVVSGRVVMNAASATQRIPTRIGVGVLRADGTVILPVPPGDSRVVVKLPPEYFVDSVTYGPERVYSWERSGRRLPSAVFVVTVPPEPQTIPDLLITLGFRP